MNGSRKSIRLKGYDYSQPGRYFVTVCVQDRECLFGDVVRGEMRLNNAGRIVADTWTALSNRFSSMNADEFIVMPNHVHGIIVFRAQQAAPLQRAIYKIVVGAGLALPATSTSLPAALGDAIRAFKSISAIGVNHLLKRVGRPLWQRNYYEHVIRNEDFGDGAKFLTN